MSTTTDTLSELLSRGTYQGMTDEEIELIISHKVAIGIAERKNLAEMAANIEARNKVAATNAVALSYAQSVLQSNLDGSTKMLEVMQPKTFEPRSIGAENE